MPVSLELAFEDVRTTPDPDRIDVTGPNGRHLVTAVVIPSDLTEARADWRRMTSSIAEMTAAVFVLLLCGPLLDWRDARDSRLGRQQSKNPESRYLFAAVAIAMAIVAARLLLRLASPADWSDAEIFSAAAYASPLLRPFLASPFDFLMTAATAASLTALVFFAFEAWRIRRRHARIAVDSLSTAILFVVAQLVAGTLAIAVLLAHHALLADTVANTTLDLLHFSLHPWNTALTALQIRHCDLGCDRRRRPRVDLQGNLSAVENRTPALERAASGHEWLGIAHRARAVAATGEWSAAARTDSRGVGCHRCNTDQRTISSRFAGVPPDAALDRTCPACAGLLPDVFALGDRAKTELVETRYGPQALNQRRTIQSLMQQSLQQIDAFPGWRTWCRCRRVLRGPRH